MRHALLALVLALICAPYAIAQVTPVRGAGCPGSGDPVARSAPALGTTFTLDLPSCGRGTAGFAVVGVASEPTVRLSGALLCVPGVVCDLVVDPLRIDVDTDLFSLVIPNLPRLIGLEFRVQAGCFDRAGGCVTLGGAVDVRIQR
ncbi:MAG: hypothetical protein U1F36_16130 [Planctomycetota bacterium]